MWVLYDDETYELKDAQAEIVALERNVSTLQSNISALKAEASTLETDLAAAEVEVSTLKAEVLALENNVLALEAGLASITFPDTNLEAAIRKAINKPGGPIYTSDLKLVYSLPAPQTGISDLTGLEYCTNLEGLDLLYNDISDILPLVANSGLSAGDFVNLMGNPLSPTSVNVYIPQLEARGVTVVY